MNVRILIKFVFLSFLMIGVANAAFNACDTTINEPWFVVNDSFGNDILIIDNDGDMYVEGKSVSTYDASLVENNNTIQIGGLYFAQTEAYMKNVYEEDSTVSGIDGVIVRADSGSDVAFIDNNNVKIAGEAIYENSQAGCLPDGQYCNGNNLDTKDYFCNITGSKTGFCDDTSLLSVSCGTDFYFCSADRKFRMLRDYSCIPNPPNSNCASTDLTIKSCPVTSTTTNIWTCATPTSKLLTTTTTTSECLPATSDCGTTTTTTTSTTSCLTDQVCSSGACNYLTVTLSGTLSGLHNYPGYIVTVNNVNVDDGVNPSYLEIRGRSIIVSGTINADNKGYNGGTGGTGAASGTIYCGAKGNAGSDGFGTYGGNGGIGGSANEGGGELSPGCRYSNGGTGGTGTTGGYAVDGGNGDATTDESLRYGSGGGAGGGGGAGSRYGSNNNYPAGTGGGGGAGGTGGGIIKLVATNDITISGNVYARGSSNGDNGNNGVKFATCVSDRYRNSAGGIGGSGTGGTGLGGAKTIANVMHNNGCTGLTNTQGGNGGIGGGGAGGGILVKAPAVTITGSINNVGSSGATNGGTFKLFYDNTYSTSSGTISTGKYYRKNY